jgi:hypothetical protein
MKKLLALFFISSLPLLTYAQTPMSEPRSSKVQTETDEMYAYAIFQVRLNLNEGTMQLRLLEDQGKMESKFSNMTFQELKRVSEVEMNIEDEISFLNMMGTYGWELAAFIEGDSESKIPGRYIFKREID